MVSSNFAVAVLSDDGHGLVEGIAQLAVERAPGHRATSCSCSPLVLSGSAIDLAFDTFVCALLDGEVDTSGYPEYNAVVGGVASHWDEATGEMIVRGVVGWGGKGVRGDTDRTASRILAGIFNSILASQYALGIATGSERPMPAAGRGGLVCAHCGFASGHERSFYCPKCGMRLVRG